MPKKIDSQEIVDAVFNAENEEQVEAQTKTQYLDKEGNVVAEGKPSEVNTKEDWVARVSSMSLSIKVTPKVGNEYLSVERAITVDVNTLDKEIVQGIWKNLQDQVLSGVFNTLSKTLKQLQDVKKGV